MTTLCIELMIYRVRIFVKSGGLKVKPLSIPTYMGKAGEIFSTSLELKRRFFAEKYCRIYSEPS